MLTVGDVERPLLLEKAGRDLGSRDLIIEEIEAIRVNSEAVVSKHVSTAIVTRRVIVAPELLIVARIRGGSMPLVKATI